MYHPYGKEEAIMAYVKLLERHSHQVVAAVHSATKPRKRSKKRKWREVSSQPLFLPDGVKERKENCFEFSWDEKSGNFGVAVGLPVWEKGFYRAAVLLGRVERGGVQIFIPLSEDNPPEVVEGRLLSATMSSSGHKKFLPRNSQEGILILVRTGSPWLVRSQFSQEVAKEAGNPQQIAQGTIRSSHGKTASLEELWLLRPGDALEVSCGDGSRFRISLSKRRLYFEEELEGPAAGLFHFPVLCGKPEEESGGAIISPKKSLSWEQALEAAQTPGRDSHPCRRRDWGRYALIRMASSEGNWQEIYEHLRANPRDVRKGVFNEFRLKCPYPTLSLSLLGELQALSEPPSFIEEFPKVVTRGARH